MYTLNITIATATTHLKQQVKYYIASYILYEVASSVMNVTHACMHAHTHMESHCGQKLIF